MEQKQKITNLVFSVIDEINKELSKDDQIIKSLDSVIYGSNGQLDSLGLVNFVVAVEQKIEDVFEKSINLTDDKAMSEKNSPFQTIETFVNYIYDVLEKMWMTKPVILISGTSRGIGKYFVEYFSEKGFIIIGCSRKPLEYKTNSEYHIRKKVFK